MDRVEAVVANGEGASFDEKLYGIGLNDCRNGSVGSAVSPSGPRLVPGAPIIFDDYGWKDYGDQQPAIDAFLEPFGVCVLELPTGQGLAFKP